MRTDDEAEAVVAIDGGGAHRGAHDCDFWLGIDVAFAEHADIAIETGDAVRIDAAEISGSENVGGLNGVVFGNAEMKKDARAEFAQGFDGENFGLDGGHWLAFLWASCLR